MKTISSAPLCIRHGSGAFSNTQLNLKEEGITSLDIKMGGSPHTVSMFSPNLKRVLAKLKFS